MVKNKHFKQLNKIIKSGKSHAGFTLIELLSGLIMSTIVVAGLGFGLYQLTKTTRDQGTIGEVRSESARVREFVSNELRRAQSLDVQDTTTGEIDIAAVAPNYTAPTNIDTATFPLTHVLSLNIPGVDERIIYSIAKPDGTWKGPLVLYRWGPNMNSNGEYTDPNDVSQWDNEPLMDGIEDTPQELPEDCVVNGTPGTPDLTITEYTGFFACMEDLDRDGLDITAQLYFTSGIDIINGNNSIYTAETQVVARARNINPSEAEDDETSPLSFRTLSAEYSLGPRGGGASCDDGNGAQSSWFMRTDFINDPDLTSNNGYSPKTWIHDPDRQGQPINIDTNHKLTIASIPIGYGPCTNSSQILSRGNEDYDETTPTHSKAGDGSLWTPLPDTESSDFTIDFSDPRTFNGNKIGDPDYDYHDDLNDHPDGQHVKVYKKGSTLADYDGYDDDPNTDDGEASLGEFLAAKGYAVLDSGEYRLVNDSDDLVANPHYIKLADNERIIAVEIGQALVGDTLPDDITPNPGFDLQDSVFILSSDKFDQEYTYPP